MTEKKSLGKQLVPFLPERLLLPPQLVWAQTGSGHPGVY